FTDEEDEGGTYETTVTAKGAGIFISTKSMVGRNVTATVTDAEGNTSEFSHPTATQVEHEMENHMPQSNSLSQNFPNPFNEVTTLRFNVAKGTNVKIVIYDLRGREVAKPVHRYYEAGAHEVRFNCGKLVSGIYFYTGEMDGSSHTQKMVLMR
ncbi:T9SS type A sorting domain-containing protein, partial [bacterium]|nr:T9SS type A sorting domain-containing protein [bacterium]